MTVFLPLSLSFFFTVTFLVSIHFLCTSTTIKNYHQVENKFEFFLRRNDICITIVIIFMITIFSIIILLFWFSCQYLFFIINLQLFHKLSFNLLFK